ncbi:MAG TPA: phosphatase domain-containing protein, partial [Chitinophagales bacterium]|nr:phosphatase domain-containing protein [Chitinophagales bacterium]
LFMVRPIANARVEVEWQGTLHHGVSEKDGFFKIEWKPTTAPEPGWHDVTVRVARNDKTIAEGSAHVFTPHRNQIAFVSDIDDTFLISHSAKLHKRLFVLLTKNAESRKPFDGVANHYRLLAQTSSDGAEPNPFFYVSSSEWNLYDYIRRFAARHEMPRGVYLLNTIKQLNQFWKTGQGKHEGKFVRIVRILKSYPHRKYVLLGDDSQQDPFIYASVVEHFPGNIHAVYLRRVRKSSEAKATEAVAQMEKAGVLCCYFKHSAEAIEHSKSIGLIQ